MKPEFKISADAPSLAKDLAADINAWSQSLSDQNIGTICLSGGSTPKLLFKELADKYADKIDWSHIHFFWGDERCVPPDDAESNFGAANELLFSRIKIPAANVHRMRGENDPHEEAGRYRDEIFDVIKPNANGMPEFGLNILGMGEDGHTASIFPNQMQLLTSPDVCDVATHPESGQKRVTLTGTAINASKQIAFLIAGASKAAVLAEILGHTGNWEAYPTSHVAPASGSLSFYLDKAAVKNLSFTPQK